MKRCVKCGFWKERWEFYAHKSAADKLNPRCKDCVREQNRLHMRRRHNVQTRLIPSGTIDEALAHTRKAHFECRCIACGQRQMVWGGPIPDVRMVTDALLDLLAERHSIRFERL